MDIKEKQEREKLYKTIWKIANELRGSVDGWDFKQYVLGLLFYRFISENIEKYINDEQRELDENFRYADLEDEKAMGIKDAMVKEKGFFILPSELFCNVQKKAKENGNLNTTLRNEVFGTGIKFFGYRYDVVSYINGKVTGKFGKSANTAIKIKRDTYHPSKIGRASCRERV